MSDLSGLVVKVNSNRLIKQDCFCKQINVLEKKEGFFIIGVMTDRTAGALLSLFKFYGSELASIIINSKYLKDKESLINDLEKVTLKNVNKYRGYWIDWDTRKHMLRCPVCDHNWKPIRGLDGRLLHREYLCPKCVPRERSVVKDKGGLDDE